jgi:hypothetical protein
MSGFGGTEMTQVEDAYREVLSQVVGPEYAEGVAMYCAGYRYFIRLPGQEKAMPAIPYRGHNIIQLIQQLL